RRAARGARGGRRDARGRRDRPLRDRGRAPHALLPSVQLGASPRAAVHLLGAAKAAARLAGRDYVTPDDVGSMAPAVLAHRLVLTPEAELERYEDADAVRTALGEVAVPR